MADAFPVRSNMCQEAATSTLGMQTKYRTQRGEVSVKHLSVHHTIPAVHTLVPGEQSSEPVSHAFHGRVETHTGEQ